MGCHTTADTDNCFIYTPFTLTQAPSFARFTTTLPGKPDKYETPPTPRAYH